MEGMLRRELKTWQKDFKAKHAREPTRADMAQHPSIAATYDAWHAIQKANAAQGIGPSTSSSSSKSKPRAGEKRSSGSGHKAEGESGSERPEPREGASKKPKLHGERAPSNPFATPVKRREKDARAHRAHGKDKGKGRAADDEPVPQHGKAYRSPDAAQLSLLSPVRARRGRRAFADADDSALALACGGSGAHSSSGSEGEGGPGAGARKKAKRLSAWHVAPDADADVDGVLRRDGQRAAISAHKRALSHEQLQAAGAVAGTATPSKRARLADANGGIARTTPLKTPSKRVSFSGTGAAASDEAGERAAAGSPSKRSPAGGLAASPGGSAAAKARAKDMEFSYVSPRYAGTPSKLRALLVGETAALASPSRRLRLGGASSARGQGQVHSRGSGSGSGRGRTSADAGIDALLADYTPRTKARKRLNGEDVRRTPGRPRRVRGACALRPDSRLLAGADDDTNAEPGADARDDTQDDAAAAAGASRMPRVNAWRKSMSGTSLGGAPVPALGHARPPVLAEGVSDDSDDDEDDEVLGATPIKKGRGALFALGSSGADADDGADADAQSDAGAGEPFQPLFDDVPMSEAEAGVAEAETAQDVEMADGERLRDDADEDEFDEGAAEWEAALDEAWPLAFSQSRASPQRAQAASSSQAQQQRAGRTWKQPQVQEVEIVDDFEDAPSKGTVNGSKKAQKVVTVIKLERYMPYGPASAHHQREGAPAATEEEDAAEAGADEHQASTNAGATDGSGAHHDMLARLSLHSPRKTALRTRQRAAEQAQLRALLASGAADAAEYEQELERFLDEQQLQQAAEREQRARRSAADAGGDADAYVDEGVVRPPPRAADIAGSKPATWGAAKAREKQPDEPKSKGKKGGKGKAAAATSAPAAKPTAAPAVGPPAQKAAPARRVFMREGRAGIADAEDRSPTKRAFAFGADDDESGSGGAGQSSDEDWASEVDEAEYGIGDGFMELTDVM